MNSVDKHVAVHKFIECNNFCHCDDSLIINMVKTFRMCEMNDILICGVSSGVCQCLAEF